MMLHTISGTQHCIPEARRNDSLDYKSGKGRDDGMHRCVPARTYGIRRTLPMEPSDAFRCGHIAFQKHRETTAWITSLERAAMMECIDAFQHGHMALEGRYPWNPAMRSDADILHHKDVMPALQEAPSGGHFQPIKEEQAVLEN
ncbi:Hypothetical predicted protein [Pelobates cultripes]|uniref:Uncharacterized protein n=1 Tax=Pelobates cultripes TaxID=61616 RepID=A0AAD1T5N5_PELCU|nr:Hypothetical predicted protein [Pelobates cultripes]